MLVSIPHKRVNVQQTCVPPVSVIGALEFSVHADSCGELTSSACVGGKSATPCVAGDAGAGPGHETMVSSKLGQIS